jgi:hypothetical protein
VWINYANEIFEQPIKMFCMQLILGYDYDVNKYHEASYVDRHVNNLLFERVAYIFEMCTSLLTYVHTFSFESQNQTANI